MQIFTGMSFRSKASSGHSTYRAKLKRKAAMIWSSDCALAPGTTRRNAATIAMTAAATDAASRRLKTPMILLARGTLQTPKEKRDASTADSIGISNSKDNPFDADHRQLRAKSLALTDSK
jgi:hypothetical protein